MIAGMAPGRGTAARAVLAAAMLCGPITLPTAHAGGTASDASRPAGGALAGGAARDAYRSGAVSILRHAYATYLGMRACSEIADVQRDGSYRPEVALAEARETLRRLDAASAEADIDAAAAWRSISALATVTAEALKTDPAAHVEICQRVGGLFRTDAANLQKLLDGLGARTPVIRKDF